MHIRQASIHAVCFAIAVLIAQEAQAMRLVRIVVYRIDADGTQTKILEDTTGDDGKRRPEEVWTYLQKASFGPKDTRNGFEATLVGKSANIEIRSKVKIVVVAAGSAMIDGLTLVAVNEARTIWRIADKDVQRATKVRSLIREKKGGAEVPGCAGVSRAENVPETRRSPPEMLGS